MAGRIVVAEGMLSPGRFYYFEQRGAIAQVYVNKGNAHELTVSTIWGAPTPESIARLPATPVITLIARTRRGAAGAAQGERRGEAPRPRQDGYRLAGDPHARGEHCAR